MILAGTLVLIFDAQGRVLLQHRTDDLTWDFPGGYLEPGESTEQAARREVREETGLDIGEMRLYTVMSGQPYYYECPNGDQVYPVCTVYLTNQVFGEPSADGQEGSEVRYFSLDNLPAGLIENDRLLLTGLKQ